MARIQGLAPQRQEPLRKRYREQPETARIQDHARAVLGTARDAFHGEVLPGDGCVRWAFGIHRAVGGDHDAPNPGDMLCAALAACLHASTRMVAEWLEFTLQDIEVTALAEVDVRGTLRVDPAVPVGFQRMCCQVRLEVPANADLAKVRTLRAAAEQVCVVMQTLKGGVEVVTDWQIDQELDTEAEGSAVAATERPEARS